MDPEQEEVLPESVMMEVLFRLPAMFVLRFARASKRWRNIINDEGFRDLHAQQAPPEQHPPLLLSSVERVLGGQQPIINMTLLGKPTTRHIIKLQPGTNPMYLPSMACDGLLCIVRRVSSKDRSTMLPERSILVCNPLTLEYLTLPPCTTEIRDCSVGLGFAPISKRYKIICIDSLSMWSPLPPLGARIDRSIEIKVYILGGEGWRVVWRQEKADFEPLKQYSSMLCADGRIYWVIRGVFPNRHPYRILSFDMEEEKPTVIGDAPGIHPGRRKPRGLQFVRLVSCGISLVIDHGSNIEIWGLKDHSRGCWDLRHNIDLQGIVNLPNFQARTNLSYDWRLTPDDRLLSVWESGEGKMILLLKDVVLSYDDGPRSCSIILMRPEASPPSEPVVKYSALDLCRGYMPSLVSLRKYGCQIGESFFDWDQELLPLPDIQLSPMNKDLTSTQNA